MSDAKLTHLHSIPNIKFFESNRDLVPLLGEDLLSRLSQAIAAKGHASLVVSGGSTPKSLFQYLSEQTIDWSKVTITLADERCVPQNHADSNALLLRQHLLRNNAAKASFIPLYEDDETPSQAAEHATEKLASINTYDVVILGMGTDGHTASLFPQAMNIGTALSPGATDCLAIDPVTNSTMRVTQSKTRLLNSNYIAVHLVGENKLTTLNDVLKDKEKIIYPTSHFIHQSKTPIDIYFAKNK